MGLMCLLVLISGTVISLIVGVATGSLAVAEMFQCRWKGVTGMYDITVISIVVACIVSLGQRIWWYPVYFKSDQKPDQRTNEAERLELLCWSLLVDMCTANNTVAIVMAGPIAKEISEEFDIAPRTIRIPSGYFYIRRTGNDSLWGTAFVCGKSHGTDSICNYAISVLSDFDGSKCSAVHPVSEKQINYRRVRKT